MQFPPVGERDWCCAGGNCKRPVRGRGIALYSGFAALGSWALQAAGGLPEACFAEAGAKGDETVILRAIIFHLYAVAAAETASPD